jgi:protein phosphatase
MTEEFNNELASFGAPAGEPSKSAQPTALRGMESVITRAIGVAAEVQPDFYSVDLKHGAVVLLTSDGLTRYLDPEEIAPSSLPRPSTQPAPP